MSGFAQIEDRLLKVVQEKLEGLNKSFAAGHQGINNAGRTGVSALAKDHIDPVIKSITMEDSDFLLTRDIPTVKATQTVYTYILKTAVQSGMDLAGWEAFLPQEDASQYMRVAEVLKVYGIRKSITQLAQLVNDAGGYEADLEKENDLNAALAMANAMERDLYTGGDNFMDSEGLVDATIAADANLPLRQVRGIQANIQEGDQSMRGIPGDFIGYGNNRSVVHNLAGSVLERHRLDKIVQSVRDNKGKVAEAHCTTAHLTEFRATFFPIERADINSVYQINGAGITNDEHEKIPVRTVGGVVYFIPTIFKYQRYVPVPVVGSVGTPPSTPVVASVAVGASVIGKGSGFKVGEKYSYRVQAANISGLTEGSASSSVTMAAGQDNRPIEVTINNQSNPKVEYFMVFRSPVETDGLAGTEMFIGKIVPSRGLTTKFVDNGYNVPGLDSILFMPKDKNRAKLAVIGNLVNKLNLGVKGTAFEVIYSSYYGCIVERPRSFSVAQNVFQTREGI